MTSTELSIIEILYEDSRTPVDRIAVMAGLSVEETKAIIKRLEDEKIIVSYPALVNWDKVNTDQVEALIEVRVTPQRGEGFDAIAEKIYRFEEVKNAYLMSGGYDLMLIVRANSLRQLSLFVSEKLSTIEHVLSTSTHFVLKKYKQMGNVMEGTTDDTRLKVML